MMFLRARQQWLSSSSSSSSSAAASKKFKCLVGCSSSSTVSHKHHHNHQQQFWYSTLFGSRSDGIDGGRCFAPSSSLHRGNNDNAEKKGAAGVDYDLSSKSFLSSTSSQCIRPSSPYHRMSGGVGAGLFDTGTATTMMTTPFRSFSTMKKGTSPSRPTTTSPRKVATTFSSVTVSDENQPQEEQQEQLLLMMLQQQRQEEEAASASLVPLPDEANVVIVGGGIVGTSVAYHLSKLGVENVILLEQDSMTDDTTTTPWRAAAGGAGPLTSFGGSLSSTNTEMRRYTRDLFESILPEETGVETGFEQVGFVELAAGKTMKAAKDRLHYLRRVAAFNRHCGVEVEEISPEQAQELFPLLHLPNADSSNDIVLAGFYVPQHGRVKAGDATKALANAAQRPTSDGGVQFFENVRVQNVTTSSTVQTGKQRRVTGVEVVRNNKESNVNGDATSESTHFIKANTVVNCTGMWARQLGQLSGVTIPNQVAEHYYLITDDIPSDFLSADGNNFHSWPIIEDPSRSLYLRPEGNGLLMGLYEQGGAPWKHDDFIPNDLTFGELENPDWDRISPYFERVLADRLAPEVVESLGMKQLFCAPESFTPDNRPIVGPAPFLQNYYVAAGLNPTNGGGIGKTLAQWIYNNGVAPSSIDVTPIHVNRFHKYQGNMEYRHGRVCESSSNTCTLLYPDSQPKTCRGAKKSPLHDRLLNNDKETPQFRDASGWESPAYYRRPTATDTATRRDRSSLQHQVGTNGLPDYFDDWKAEHIACREAVGLFDKSFTSKFLVEGYDAGKFLNYLSTGNVVKKNPDDPNEIIYAQWLNEYGYLEADVTIIQRTEDSFLIVATDAMENHVYSHMMKRLTSRSDWHVHVSDVSSGLAQINLQGPQSRKLLQALTPDTLNMDNENFAFRRADDIKIGMFGQVLCCRITYIGELGYELFVPVEQATYVYDTIIETANRLQLDDETFYLKHAGLNALNSLRLVRT